MRGFFASGRKAFGFVLRTQNLNQAVLQDVSKRSEETIWLSSGIFLNYNLHLVCIYSAVANSRFLISPCIVFTFLVVLPKIEIVSGGELDLRNHKNYLVYTYPVEACSSQFTLRF